MLNDSHSLGEGHHNQTGRRKLFLSAPACDRTLLQRREPTIICPRRNNPAHSYTTNTMSQLWVYTGNGNVDVVFEAGEWKTVSGNTSVDAGRNAPQSALTYSGSKGTLATFNTTGTLASTSPQYHTKDGTGSHLSVLGAVMLSEDSDKQLMIAFSLDGSTPSLSIPSSSTQNGTAYTMYSSPRLSNDTHTLQLMALEIDESAYTDLQEVHVYYVTPDYQGTIHTNAVNGSDELDANPAAGSSGKSSVPVAAIVGGSVGGTVLLVATILAVYFFFIKPRRNSRPYIYYSTNLDDIGQASHLPTLYGGTELCLQIPRNPRPSQTRHRSSFPS